MIKNRSEFEQYILEQLGAPIIQVNVTQKQLENCINDALQYFTIYHYEGTRHTYYPLIITPSILQLTTSSVPQFHGGEKVVGLTSNAEATIANERTEGHRIQSIAGTVYVYDTKGEFVRGEHVKIRDKIYTLSNSDNFFKKGIIDERRAKLPDWMVGVIRVLPSSQALSSQNLFDLQYQLRLNDFNATQLTTHSLIYFEQAMEHISLLNWELTAKPDFDFSYYDGYLYPTTNWNYDFCVGDFMIVEGYRSHDFEGQSRIWNEPWLKSYAVQLTKRLWSQSLKKYSGVQLPGGVTFNADQMYQEAQTEIDKLEQQLQSLSWPSAFMVG